MIRDLLSLRCLRSFVTIADLGSITKAAEKENISQPAISLQGRRLEDILETPLLERHARGMMLTEAGRVLLIHARRMLSENQNAVAAVRQCTAGTGIVLGVPHDIVNPAVTVAVKNFNSLQRQTQVNIRLAPSATLKGLLKSGEVQIILTTEFTGEPGGIALGERDVIWTGAPDSQASKRRPIPLAYVRGCLLAKEAQATLADAGVDWLPVIDSDSVLAVEAAVAADRGIYAAIRDGHTVHLRPLPAETGLPPLRSISVFCYRSNGTGFESELSELVDMLHQALSRDARPVEEL